MDPALGVSDAAPLPLQAHSHCGRIGVPYFSFRITHAKHHAANGHLYQDQVYIPKTRSQLGLPALDPSETLAGSSVTDKVKKELYEALGDSPIATAVGVAFYLASFRLCLPV